MRLPARTRWRRWLRLILKDHQAVLQTHDGGAPNREVSMYCPRCGNQPASDRVRFCPSCGFRLDGVADLLVRDGVPAGALNASQTNSLRSGEPSERKRGVRRGAKMVFTSLTMFLPIFGLCFLFDSGFPLILPG